MALIPTVLAGAVLAVWMAYVIDAWTGRHGIADLRVDRATPGQRPSLAIVIAARNEHDGIEAALRSVLAVDYPEFEVVVVDDRSEDETPVILDRLAREHPALRVVRVDRLPPGWLGKNHALAAGAAASRSELILFSDADVVFEPDAPARAVDWLTANDLDHLAGAVDVEARGIALQLFVVAFALVFNGYLRPWRAADPGSRAAIGIGAFNLVRREAYDAIGGHAPIRMRPDDDLRLGMALKGAGYRQQLALLGALATVEWYPDLRAAVRGLEKNSLAAVDYRLWLLVAGTAGLLLGVVGPFVAPLLVEGAARWLWLAAALLIVGLSYGFVRETSFSRWTALAVPVGLVLVLYTTTRAAWITYREGGIRWRGTFYPLAELRGR